MAFFANTAAALANNTFEKASGFINISLPTKGGSTRKLDAIRLRDSVPAEKALREWLEADAGNIEKLKEVMLLDYRNATPSKGSEFALD